MSNYLRTVCSRKTLQKWDCWSAANSSPASCVIAKNSVLILSACTQYSTDACLRGIFFSGWAFEGYG